MTEAKKRYILHFRVNNMDNEILSKRLDVESKTFFFDYKENPKGKFLRIIEKAGGKKNAIVLPDTGLEEFIKVLESIKSNR
ncbi:MAG: DNA-binding protein [Candidatus Desantisbacteria bacterium]